MDKISCEVIQDLLPLYCDDICSQASQELVKGHLEGCPGCAGILEKMKEGCLASQTQEQERERMAKSLASVWKESVKRSMLRGAALALCLCLLLAGAYWGLTRMVLVSVPADRVEASVVKETEAMVELIIEVTDGKRVSASSTKATEDGKYYIIAKQGLLAEINGAKENWIGYFGVPKEAVSDSGKRVGIREIYYGTERENVLLWKAE